MMMKTSKHIFSLTAAASLLMATTLLSSCGGDSKQGGEAGDLTGAIQIDGSSTVYPVTEAVAEEFRAEMPDVKVTVGVSGTGGGFKKFVRGEIDINNASRAISTEEAAQAKEHNITFEQLEITYDGLTVVVHPQNDWVKDITVAELK